MKSLVAIICLAFAGLANAGTYATAPNQDGGLIMVTDQRCPWASERDDLNYIQSTMSNGGLLEGCAQYDSTTEHFKVVWGKTNGRWRDSSVRMYSIRGFTLTPYGEQQLRSSRSSRF